VELLWDVSSSAALDDDMRARVMQRLAARLVDGVLSVTASEHRSQLRNRLAARARLAALVSRALVPPVERQPTRPPAGAGQRRLEAKRRRSQLKAARQRPSSDTE
jgi:ribosome-associated protein